MDPRHLSGFHSSTTAIRAVFLGAALFTADAQTTIDLRTQAKSVDFSAAVTTRPMKTGTSLPTNCAVGEMFFKSDATAGGNLYGCASPNAWTAQAGGGTTGRTGVLNASQSFTSATSVTFAHGLGTVNVLVQCYDGASRAIEYQSLTVTDNNNVSVQFAAPQTGRCVANGAGGSGGGSGGGGESNTASNVGNGGAGLFLQKFGADLQFKNVNAASGRIAITNDAANREIDIDVAEAGLNLSALGGALSPAQIAASGKQGNGSRVQMFGGGAAGANDCANFDAAGNLVSAGAPCGTGSGSGGGETNTASNAGVGGVGLFHQKSGADLQFKNLNAASSRISLFNDSANREVDIDIVTGNIDLATLGGTVATSQVATASKQGAGSKLQTFGGGPVAANDCAKFDSSGGLVSAGSPCGAGGSGGGDTIASDFGIVIVETSPGVKRVGIDTAAVPAFLTATASLDFGTIVQDACSELTLPLPGAATGDALAPGWPHTLDAGLTGVMFVSSQNTVTVRLCKFTAGAVDPANQAFRATLVRSF